MRAHDDPDTLREILRRPAGGLSSTGHPTARPCSARYSSGEMSIANAEIATCTRLRLVTGRREVHRDFTKCARICTFRTKFWRHTKRILE